ncbi:unnamed protein product [Protopolystoma xenopodis]|uniref:Membrane-bound transcription factor site-2 protease n=1 Tax=Protopolystoma xenopodis TaxID=117903 RepID=A0A3S5BXS1_9PLAT|nr:unnamed protein product [Protopolystoma xenopodis]
MLQANLFTHRFNYLFDRICQLEFVPWNAWFSAGALFSSLFMIMSVFILLLLVYNTVTKQPIEKQVIKPVMPGVNLPLSHLGFYMLTLLICAILHEAGHALAALRERVRLHGFGIFLLGVYPGAFVNLDRNDLQSLSPVRQLRIYCAGVWHNAVIVFLSIALFYSLPWVLMPAYFTGQGVGVTYLKEGSVVTGNRGLLVGDAITRINACPVQNQTDWYRCLEEAHTRPTGYCVSGTYLSIVGSHDPARINQSHHYPGARRALSAVAIAQNIHIGPADISSKSEAKPAQNAHKPVDCCPSQSASTHLCFTYFVYGVKSNPSRVLIARIRSLHHTFPSPSLI